jgi:hypothetical protein
MLEEMPGPWVYVAPGRRAYTLATAPPPPRLNPLWRGEPVEPVTLEEIALDRVICSDAGDCWRVGWSELLGRWIASAVTE